MDWDRKMPYWGCSPELEQNAGPSFNPSAAGTPNCSVDLKLGGSGEPGRPERWEDEQGAPVKRARPATSNAGQAAAASCLVEGCVSDLGKGREYHRRHKVCEAHSKTQVVIVGGQQQRFCQQCSRFHLLGEFDEVKRSCRKRLDSHNRRRRKPQQDRMSSAGVALAASARFASFPPIFLPFPENNKAGIVKTGEESLSLYANQLTIPSSFSISFEDGRNKFPFLQGGNASASIRAPGRQPPLEDTTILAKGIPRAPDSVCALSLLSSPFQNPSSLSSATTNVGHVSGGEHRIPGFSCSSIEDERGGGGGSLLASEGFFHIVGEECSEGTSYALPSFSWQLQD